ncbi:MAG: winged helix-turn-helix domain-containing protein [Thermoleophilaceae bacterium]
MSSVSFLTNHAHVLACVAGTPGMRLRDIADCAGITERAAHRIVCELETDGYLTRYREGRRNYYEVHPDGPLDPTSQADASVGDLLKLLDGSRAQPATAAAA